MIAKVHPSGKGFGGLVEYCLGEGELEDDEQKGEERARTADRVDWTETVNLPTDDPRKAARMMAATAQYGEELKKQAGVPAGGRQLEKPVCHFTLSWKEGERPGRQTMREAALESLQALELERREALIVAHRDRKSAHVHVIVNRVSFEDGRAAKLSQSHYELSKWAEEYERRSGEIQCRRRVEHNRLRTEGHQVYDTGSRQRDRRYKRQRAAKRRGHRHRPPPRMAERQRREWRQLYQRQRKERKGVERGGGEEMAQRHQKERTGLAQRLSGEAARLDAGKWSLDRVAGGVASRWGTERAEQERREKETARVVQYRKQRSAEDARPRRRRERETEAPAPRREREAPSRGADVRAAPAEWYQYQERWPEHAGQDRKLFETLIENEHNHEERREYLEHFMRDEGYQKWDGSRAMEHVQQQSLPAELAPKGEQAPDAAKDAESYYMGLPEKYQRQWDESGIAERIRDAAQKAESSLRSRLSGDRQQYVADAVRRECGAQAQRFDRAMRYDQARHRPMWEVQQRWEKLQHEQYQKARDNDVRASRQRMERLVTRSVGQLVAEQEQAPQGGGGTPHDRDIDLIEL